MLSSVSNCREAIERLNDVDTTSTSTYAVVNALMGDVVWTQDSLRDVLVELLTKAESNWWINTSAIDDLANVSDDTLMDIGLMRLPRDRDGEVIRLGDMVDLYGETYEVDGIKTRLANNSGYYSRVIVGKYHKYSVDPRTLHHHHRRQTIEDVLTEFQLKTVDWCDGHDPTDSADGLAVLLVEYAEKLKEVAKDE